MEAGSEKTGEGGVAVKKSQLGFAERWENLKAA